MSDQRTSARVGVATLMASLLLALRVVLPAAVLAAGPPFPSPEPGQRVYDTADVLLPSTRINAEQIAQSIADSSGAQVVVYTQRLDTAEISAEDATTHARDLLDAWALGGDERTAMVILADLTPDGTLGEVALVTGAGMEQFIDAAERTAIQGEMAPWLESGDLDTAIIVALAEAIRETLNAEVGPDGPGVPAVPGEGGPPANAHHPVHRSRSPSRTRPSTTMPVSSARRPSLEPNRPSMPSMPSRRGRARRSRSTARSSTTGYRPRRRSRAPAR